KLAATDLEIGMKTLVPAKVEESGSVTVPARLFFEVVSHLDEKLIEVEMETETGMLELKGEGFKYQFNVLMSDEYPVLPDTPGENKITLTQKAFKEVLKETLFAAAPVREDNPVLTGLLFKLDKEVLTIVALDGYRLAKRSLKIAKNTFSRTLIVPSRALSELIKVLQDVDDPVEIYFGEHQIVFKLNETILFSRLLEGQFPQFERVIPEKSDVVVKVEKESFLQALRRASLLALDRESPKLVKLNLKGNKISITANTQDVGQAYEEVKVETGKKTEKEEVTVAFNAKYWIDALSTLDFEKIRIELGSSTNPGVLKPETGDDFIYVVMPVRTVSELVKV
ncbi:MAG: DNA polymerase III subunit beta, partial [Firmicutes bacterium]|nr:DNA polymerase III subunit beta [Bacillota bacterium]